MARGEVLEETGTEKATESRRGPKVPHGTVRGDPSGHHPWSKHQSEPKCAGSDTAMAWST